MAPTKQATEDLAQRLALNGLKATTLDRYTQPTTRTRAILHGKHQTIYYRHEPKHT